MRFIIVTGMSGAGKSSVLKMLEDVGFFCIDNLPIPLIPKLMQLTFGENTSVEKAALGIDIRNGKGLDELERVLTWLNEMEYNPEILFLDCSTEVLVKRYKETRRIHPLAGEGRVDRGIEEERKKLDFLRKCARYIIDTSHLLVRELKAEIDKILFSEEKYNNFYITVLSFGFKYGIPTDSDLVFDVRFLPNPFYIPELKNKTGNDKEVADYVMQNKAAHLFLDRLGDMLAFLIPNYIVEGKNQLVVSIGCTGGKHRSVTLANALSEYLTKFPYGIRKEHRDIDKDAKRCHFPEK